MMCSLWPVSSQPRMFVCWLQWTSKHSLMWGIFVYMLCSVGMCASQQASCTGYIQRLHIGMFMCLFLYINVHSLSMSIPEVPKPIDKFTVYLFHKNKIFKMIFILFSLYENFHYNVLFPDYQQTTAFKRNLIIFFDCYYKFKIKHNLVARIINLLFRFPSVCTQTSTPYHFPLWVPRDLQLHFREQRCVLSSSTCETD